MPEWGSLDILLACEVRDSGSNPGSGTPGLPSQGTVCVRFLSPAFLLFKVYLIDQERLFANPCSGTHYFFRGSIKTAKTTN